MQTTLCSCVASTCAAAILSTKPLKKCATHTHLRSAGDHVLDEVAVTGGINDGDIELGSLELPQGNVDGDTTLALSLELVEHPGILERALAHLSSLLLELLDGTLVNTTALVDQVTSGGRLAGIDLCAVREQRKKFLVFGRGKKKRKQTGKSDQKKELPEKPTWPITTMLM